MKLFLVVYYWSDQMCQLNMFYMSDVFNKCYLRHRCMAMLISITFIAYYIFDVFHMLCMLVYRKGQSIKFASLPNVLALPCEHSKTAFLKRSGPCPIKSSANQKSLNCRSFWIFFLSIETVLSQLKTQGPPFFFGCFRNAVLDICRFV